MRLNRFASQSPSHHAGRPTSVVEVAAGVITADGVLGAAAAVAAEPTSSDASRPRVATIAGVSRRRGPSVVAGCTWRSPRPARA